MVQACFVEGVLHTGQGARMAGRSVRTCVVWGRSTSAQWHPIRAKDMRVGYSILGSKAVSHQICEHGHTFNLVVI